MKHRRTTWAGGLTIVGGVLGFIASCIANGGFPHAEAWSLLGAALTAGGGLIAAADGKNVR